MVYIKNRSIIFILLFVLGIAKANAQESLWKTFNPYPDREVPSYSGGLSPFPQKQEEVEEIEFESSYDPFAFDNYDTEELTEKEKKLMLTTSILAEIKQFLAEERAYEPNIKGLVVEAIAKSNGTYRALITKKWKVVGDTINVPIYESKNALDLLDRLRMADEYLAETVEDAVMNKTAGKDYEILKIINITPNQVEFTDTRNEPYIIKFVNSPY